MTQPTPRKRWFFSAWVDSLGTAGALICAIHCALLPFVLAVLPALGLGILASSGFEYGYVAFASVLALASLWQGYRRHRVYRALAFLVPGLVAVWAGVLMPSLHENVIAHAVTMTFGGTLIAVAHLINLRLTHGHVHDAGCAHSH
ncbi:MAG TPA: MerC domain-containing protein [Arenimonas sp.]|uniref:MerC domain-containing protein n=1 Tax=Arenimonas sp. TaxID=1872635 RepID=UPI002C1EBC71|nr:MerC domain-containing protein [Arenimonas sp.]HMB56181.1 MerC domain-containing protein [Arenimonas sp.]